MDKKEYEAYEKALKRKRLARKALGISILTFLFIAMTVGMALAGAEMLTAWLIAWGFVGLLAIGVWLLID